MQNLLNRKENENDIEYVLRLVELKCDKAIDCDWQDIVEATNLGVHRDSLRKASTLDKVGINALVKYFREKQKDGIKDKELIIELEEKILEFKKEKVKCQDQKRELQNFVRTDARWENLKEEILDEVRKFNQIKPLLSEMPLVVESTDKPKACLLFSDSHIGADIDTYMNKYNIEIAKERISRLRDKTLEYCKINKVDELNLEFLGDLLHGNIHVSARIYSCEDVIKQTILCSELLSEFIYSISQSIKKVNVYFSVGNHSRTTANYKEHIDEENFEYIIQWHLKGRLGNLKNVEFKENKYDKELAIIEVFDKKIGAIHGHKDRPNNALNNLNRYLKGVLDKLDEVHMGHYHKFQVRDGVLMNGCLCGADQYAQSKRFMDKPHQVMKIYHSNGDENIYNILL